MIDLVELISNLLSWAITIVIWFRIHDLIEDGKPWATTRSVLWAVFALALVFNTVAREIDSTYVSVLYGAVVLKVAFLPALILDAIAKDRADVKTT